MLILTEYNFQLRFVIEFTNYKNIDVTTAHAHVKTHKICMHINLIKVLVLYEYIYLL